MDGVSYNIVPYGFLSFHDKTSLHWTPAEIEMITCWYCLEHTSFHTVLTVGTVPTWWPWEGYSGAERWRKLRVLTYNIKCWGSEISRMYRLDGSESTWRILIFKSLPGLRIWIRSDLDLFYQNRIFPLGYEKLYEHWTSRYGRYWYRYRTKLSFFKFSGKK